MEVRDIWWSKNDYDVMIRIYFIATGSLQQPSFSGNGYIVVPALYTQETRSPTIILRFRPIEIDGVLLFNFHQNNYIGVFINSVLGILSMDK